MATLRAFEVAGIPEEMAAEPINCELRMCLRESTLTCVRLALVLRVLHRLRFLAEQVPFDVATFSYMSPLLSQIFNKGGIGLTEDDDPLEQVALSLDLVKFHSAECALILPSFV